MSKDISLDARGIKFSYSRFIADTAAGYVLLLLALVWYYTLQDRLELAGMFSPGPEVKAFVGLMLFLLATPIGLAFNAITYFLFDRRVSHLQRHFYEVEYAVVNTKSTHGFMGITEFFGIHGIDEWRMAANFFEKFLGYYKPSLVQPYFFLESLGIFFRNMVLLVPMSVLTVGLCWLTTRDWVVGTWFLVIAVCSMMVVSGLLVVAALYSAAGVIFYYHTTLLSRTWVLCVSMGITSSQVGSSFIKASRLITEKMRSTPDR